MERVDKESAGGIIVNEKNEVVVVFTDTKSWQFPKGTVEKGENYFKTAIREIEEETGLKNLKLIKKLQTYIRSSHDKGKPIIRGIHYYLFNINKQKVIPKAEVSKCEWISINKAEDKLTYGEDKEFFNKVKKEIIRKDAKNQN